MCCQSFFERMVSARTLGVSPSIASEYGQEVERFCGLFGDGAATNFAAGKRGWPLPSMSCLCVRAEAVCIVSRSSKE